METLLRDAALAFLRGRKAKAGETVQVGWFIFNVVEGEDGLDLETLDFRKLTSFTKDFSIVERIHETQTRTLRQLGQVAEDCTLGQPALVSRSYFPMASNVFIERQASTGGSDSGWYVGLIDDVIDLNNQSSFVHRSLYELTISDERLARFWLLPSGYRVIFSDGEPEIQKVGPA